MTIGKIERITAKDVKVGDKVGHARHGVQEVVAINPGNLSVYLTLANGRRIRPNYNTKLWRIHE